MSGMVARFDDWGRPAWIAAMIVGFVLFWPVGLALLFFLIGSGRMGFGRCSSEWNESGRDRWERKMARMQDRMNRWASRRPQYGHGFAPTGNRAFDEYRSETIRRLEDEAQEFGQFLDRLRHARDKAEFDQFMADRRDRRDDQDDRPAPGENGPRRDDQRPAG